MIPKLIGFAGPAGVGKTTAAQWCVKHYFYHRLSFAWPIREMLHAMGLDWDALLDRKEEPHPLLCGQTPRWAMQSLGTEWGRRCIGDDLWVGLAMHHFHELMHESDTGVVFDDLRFDNEAEAIRLNGGINIVMTRPGYTWSPTSHQSERGIDRRLTDYIVYSESLDDLYTKLRLLFNTLEER